MLAGLDPHLAESDECNLYVLVFNLLKQNKTKNSLKNNSLNYLLSHLLHTKEGIITVFLTVPRTVFI